MIEGLLIVIGGSLLVTASLTYAWLTVLNGWFPPYDET